MVVHFDGDLLVYRAGFAAEKMHYYLVRPDSDKMIHFQYIKEAREFMDANPGEWTVESGREVEPLKNALYNVKSIIMRTLEDLNSTPDDMRLFLSGPTNFRDGIATIKPYKGNRDEAHRPVHGPNIKKYMERRFGAEYTEDEEADDAVAYNHYQMWQEDPFSSIIVSTDKDLDMIPGMHYNFVKERRYYVTPGEAEHNFHLQLLTGDSTDNIQGVPGVGKVKARKALEASEDVWETIETYYKNAYKEDWYEALVENGRLLWMRRKPHEWWLPPGNVLEDKIP